MLTRRLEWTPKGKSPRIVEVEISEPRPSGAEWACTLEVRGFDVPFREDFSGPDALFAISIATWSADTAVRTHAHGGRLTLNGGDYLGFLPPDNWGRRSWWRRLRAWWRRRCRP